MQTELDKVKHVGRDGFTFEACEDLVHFLQITDGFEVHHQPEQLQVVLFLWTLLLSEHLRKFRRCLLIDPVRSNLFDRLRVSLCGLALTELDVLLISLDCHGECLDDTVKEGAKLSYLSVVGELSFLDQIGHRVRNLRQFSFHLNSVPWFEWLVLVEHDFLKVSHFKDVVQGDCLQVQVKVEF